MVDFGPQAPINTTTVATAVERRWACHTRKMWPADRYERQRCNVVPLHVCSVVYLWYICPVGCVLVREGTYVQNRPHAEKPGKSSYPLLAGKNLESPPRELRCSDRVQTSTTGSGRPSCFDVVTGFYLKVLVRRDKLQSRRKFHKYTYTHEAPSRAVRCSPRGDVS